MSKKDTINQRLNTFNNYLSALLTTIIALCGFTFSSAGGIINSPKWVGGFVMQFIAISSLLLTVGAIIYCALMLSKNRILKNVWKENNGKTRF